MGRGLATAVEGVTARVGGVEEGGSGVEREREREERRGVGRSNRSSIA